MFTERACALGLMMASLGSLQAQTAAPEKTCAANELFAQTKDLLAEKRYDEAARSLDRLRTCSQLRPLETFEMGWLYGRARRFQTALSVFDRVPPEVPDRATHSYAVALSRFELSDYRGAIAALEQLRSAGIYDAKCSNLLAVSYSKLGLYKEAYAVLTKQAAQDPNDLSTYLNLVTVCADGGDYARAAQVASQAAVLFPKSADVLVVRGAANSLLGRSGDASQDFSLATQLAPNRADAHFFLALMDYNQAQYPAALAVLKKAEQEGLEDSDLHYLTAETLLKIDGGNAEAAVAELGRAVQLNPESVAARTLRGRLLLEKGQAKEAVQDLEVAKREDAESRSTLYNLARAYRALGKNEQAAALFRQLRSEKPDILKEMSDRRLSESLADKGAEK